MALKNKVAVITGAARGMGRAYAQDFLNEGAKIVGLDVSWEPTGFSGDRDDAWAKELASRPDDALMITCDIGDPEDVQHAFDEAMKKFGTADILLNNAGVRMRDLYPGAGRTTTLDTSRPDWERMFGVTVFGAVQLTQLFVKPMMEKRRGSVVSTISSGAIHHSHGGAYMALRPNSREVPYQPAKAALLTTMFYLADEIKDTNVAVNIVIPGHTRTTGFDEQNAQRMLANNAQAMGTGGQQRAGGPVPLVPEHMVPLVKFLADLDTNEITGRCFDVTTWNLEHGLGGQTRWRDDTAEEAVAQVLAEMQKR